eukprot:2068582-Pyramimonas_sp.AAC.1
MCLLDEQCGGVAHKGPEMAVHGLHLASIAAHKRKFSTLILSLDLVDAFYSAIKQFALSLPGEEEKLEDALQQVQLPPILLEGAKVMLAASKPLEAHVPSAHLLALIQESQRGTFWQVRLAKNPRCHS